MDLQDFNNEFRVDESILFKIFFWYIIDNIIALNIPTLKAIIIFRKSLLFNKFTLIKNSFVNEH